MQCHLNLVAISNARMRGMSVLNPRDNPCGIFNIQFGGSGILDEYSRGSFKRTDKLKEKSTVVNTDGKGGVLCCREAPTTVDLQNLINKLQHNVTKLEAQVQIQGELLFEQNRLLAQALGTTLHHEILCNKVPSKIIF